jgi:predicted nucleic acid-binding protein
VQFLIETDVLKEYLISATDEPSTLRKALVRGVCYTTMLNALELFRAAESKEEHDTVMQLLMVVRVLGFNSRYAETFAGIGHEIKSQTGIILSERELLIVAMAKTSKLTIVSKESFELYKSAKAVPVQRSAEEVPSGE